MLSRLTLRPLRARDARALFEARRETAADLARWTTRRAGSLSSQRAFIRRMQADRRAGRTFVFGIFEGPTLLGTVGFGSVDRRERKAEVFYSVRRSASGRGVATEALALATAYGFERLRLERLYLRAAVENPASRRVAEKAGYRFEGTLRRDCRSARGEFLDCALLAMLREEWRAERGRRR